MLSQKTINEIVDQAAVSNLARYSWPGRGKAPIGYVKGMAVTYGLCLQKLMARDSAALAMVRVVDDGKDVFDHLADEISDAGLSTAGASDVDRLRALFVVLMGLGMRESSGRYCCGRDTTAAIPPSSDTVEAGLFQQSWDSRRASPEIPKLFKGYLADNRQGFLGIFKEGVKAKAGDLDNYGDGDGEQFQELCKARPAFAVECAAIGLRTLYTHWGPIVRHEVALRPEADALFKQVEAIVGAVKPAKPPALISGAPWVDEVRKDTGIQETSGGADNKLITDEWKKIIAKTFPDMASYAQGYVHDSIPWCGWGLGAAFARVGIRPPFGPTDTDKFMWADSWCAPNWGIRLDKPIPGCVMVFTRNGGGHVTMLEKMDGADACWVRGYNQSDEVNVTHRSMAQFKMATWPKGVQIASVIPDIRNAVPPGSEV